MRRHYDLSTKGQLLCTYYRECLVGGRLRLPGGYPGITPVNTMSTCSWLSAQLTHLQGIFDLEWRMQCHESPVINAEIDHMLLCHVGHWPATVLIVIMLRCR